MIRIVDSFDCSVDDYYAGVLISRLDDNFDDLNSEKEHYNFIRFYDEYGELIKEYKYEC